MDEAVTVPLDLGGGQSFGETPMSDLMHEVRNSLADATRAFRLEPDAVSWREGDRQERLLYSEIASLHLSSYSDLQELQRQCTLTDRAGKTLKIRSHHYVSLGNFEDRTATYAPFIRALIDRLAGEGSPVAFEQGSRIMGLVWTAIFWLSAIMIVGFVALLFSGDGFSLGALVPIAILLGFVAFSRVMMGQSKAGSFDPKSPSSDLLGG